MKKGLFTACFIIFSIFSFGQVNTDVLLKSTWTKILAKHKLKNAGTLSSFDADGKWVEWPILFQPNESEKVEEIDNMEFHMSLPENQVKSLSDLMNYAPISTAMYKSKSFDLSQFEGKDYFSEALKNRFGSTKNLYCLSNENQSPDEFVVIIFTIKNGIAKMVGFWINYYRG